MDCFKWKDILKALGFIGGLVWNPEAPHTCVLRSFFPLLHIMKDLTTWSFSQLYIYVCVYIPSLCFFHLNEDFRCIYWAYAPWRCVCGWFGKCTCRCLCNEQHIKTKPLEWASGLSALLKVWKIQYKIINWIVICMSSPCSLHPIIPTSFSPLPLATFFPFFFFSKQQLISFLVQFPAFCWSQSESPVLFLFGLVPLHSH